MKKKATIIIVITCIFIFTSYFIFDSIFPKAKDIEHPTFEEIVAVEILIDDRKVELNIEELEDLISHLSYASATRKGSYNDYPSIQPYYQIVIVTSEKEYHYFIYQENNQTYLEIPYIGIYSCNSRLWSLIVKNDKN